MDTVNVEQLHVLSEHRDPNCVSLFMLALPAGREVRQDPVLLKDRRGYSKAACGD
jgi:hypothetical protein